MAVQVSYPGIYTLEFTPGAPIVGVGTSTAAFIGPASHGELDTPMKITSWDLFREVFGDQPLPGFYLWYAVRGFFENGGLVCYIVRASNGTYGEVLLNNVAGDPMIRVRARQPGNAAMSIEVFSANLLTGANLYAPDADFAVAPVGREVTVDGLDEDEAIANAAQFRPTDWLDIEGQRVQLLRVMGNVLLLANELDNPPNNGGIRLADLAAGTRTIRILQAGGMTPLAAGVLVPGTALTIDPGGATAEGVFVDTVQTEPLQTDPAITTYRVTLRAGLTNARSLDPASPVTTMQSEEFDFQVTQSVASPPYENLSIDPAHPRYFLTTINDTDTLVRLELIEPPSTATLPESLPDNFTSALPAGLVENLGVLGNADFLEALDTLRVIDDVNIIAIPDGTTPAVQQALIAHCEQMADRFAVLDSRPGLELFGQDPATSIEAQRSQVDSLRGYAALYYPWLRVSPSGVGAPILVPPSGYVCGIMARSDNNRGVHKAPANEIVNGALGVERTMSDVDQGQLNLPPSTNIIRVFAEGGRPVLWGARTTATDLNWQYVNIRRLFLFLEESIEEGVKWAVFEPNNQQLWQKLKRTITEFLTRVWRDGALFGGSPKEAFYVRIDQTNNPFSEQALGWLNIEIGVRPSYTVEFMIISIGISPGGSILSEG